jgi:hypothetical protein
LNLWRFIVVMFGNVWTGELEIILLLMFGNMGCINVWAIDNILDTGIFSLCKLGIECTIDLIHVSEVIVIGSVIDSLEEESIANDSKQP